MMNSHQPTQASHESSELATQEYSDCLVSDPSVPAHKAGSQDAGVRQLATVPLEKCQQNANIKGREVNFMA